MINNKIIRLSQLFLVVSVCIVLVNCNKNKKEEALNNGDSSGVHSSGGDESVSQNTLERALFTDLHLIKDKKSSTRVMDSLVYYLNKTKEGAVVHLSVFLFSYPPVVNAVRNAFYRGVQMNIIIDSSRSDSRNSNNSTIETFHNLFKGSSSKMVALDNEINPEYSINHEKYVTFSKVNLPNGKTVKNVVFSSSHNFTLGQTKMVQDAVILANDSLYNAYVDNWNELASRAKSDMKGFTYQVFNINKDLSVFFFPRRKNGKWDGFDTIIEQLNKLSDYDKDSIRVFMSTTWTGNRGKNVANKLTTLQRAGVTVEMITMENVSNDMLSAFNSLAAAGAYVKLLDKSKRQVHSKIMLIKGVWNGEMQTILLTGSENYGKGALQYNNNQLLRIKNSKLFKDYWDYFEKAKNIL